MQVIELVETIGPIQDPTQRLKAAPNLAWQKELVQAALTFRDAIEGIIIKYGEEDVKE